MVKKLFYVLMAFLFICAFTITTTPVYAQEEEEEVVVEDVADISLEDLLNVEITTAGKKAERIADIPASVVLITRADIERYGYQTLDEVLENVPGLFGIDQRGTDGMIFGVRGFWAAFANNIIFLINGVRQERMQSDGGIYPEQYIPVEAIDRIEVIRGPMSVIYGPGAFFGVINIFTNDTTNPGLVSISGGMEQSVRLAARGSFQKDDLSLAFNAGYYNTAGPDIPHTDMSTQDLSIYTTFNSTKDLWENEAKFFSFSGAYKGFYANVTYSRSDKEWYLIFLPSTPDGSVAHRTMTSISFGYKEDFSDQFSLDGKFSYRKGSTWGDFSWFIPEGTLNIGGDYNLREEYEVDLTAIYTPSEKFNITAGLWYKKRIVEQLQSVYPLLDFHYRIAIFDPIVNQAGYIQADIAPTKALRFVLGARLEKATKYSTYYRDLFAYAVGADADFEYTKTEVIPRAALILYLNERNIVKLLYGKAINMPSFYHTVAQATSVQPPVEPEFITTFEFNYLASFSENFNVNASVFYNKFDGLIINQPVFDPVTQVWTTGFNTNSGELRTIGGELTMMAKTPGGFMMELSGTLQQTDDLREGYEDIDVAYSPKLLAYLKASYKFGETATIALTGRYVGEMETLWDYAIQNPDGSFGARIANKVDGYFLMGANLRFELGNGFYLNLSGSNLFDTKYLFPSYTINAAWADLGLAGYGRMIMATIGKKFVPVP
ncbi:TonB-dependent receptor [Acidobacteriota bacterium]